MSKNQDVLVTLDGLEDNGMRLGHPHETHIHLNKEKANTPPPLGPVPTHTHKFTKFKVH